MLQNVYISLPYIMAARTVGIDKIEEITSLLNYVFLLKKFFITDTSKSISVQSFASFVHRVLNNSSGQAFYRPRQTTTPTDDRQQTPASKRILTH